MFDTYLEPKLLQDDVELIQMHTEEEDEKIRKEEIPEELPILPLRNTVLYPGVVIPITVGREKSIRLVKDAEKKDKIIGVIAQKEAGVEEPGLKDIYEVGTVALIKRVIKMDKSSNVTIVIQGRRKFRLQQVTQEEPYIKAKVIPLDEQDQGKDKESVKLMEDIKAVSTSIIELSPHLPTEATMILKQINIPTFLINFIINNLNLDVTGKQEILEMDSFKLKAKIVLKHLNEEFQMLQLKNEIQAKVHSDLDEQQRQFLLTQQLKTIQEELGADGPDHEIKRLRDQAAKKKWSETVEETFNKELEKLQRMNPAIPDYTVTLNYLELLLDLPWESYTKDKFDLGYSKRVLDKDHYGLEKVKTRILEYLAVLKLKGDMKSPILCFVGPPGTGKTSLGKSIASALNRKFIRMSLGGLRDEAEIRGHRKTYIGAMPGRILQSLKKAKSSNPVFVLDELDKIGADFRGDPASALLEVLDPEQNSTFYDNFLELEYDLSKVMFITTANTLSGIHPALIDRIEIIEINGYAVEEKIQIAKKHLIPRLRKEHGLTNKNIVLGTQVLETLIADHTREAGVRMLEKRLASIMRNSAMRVASKKKYKPKITKENLREILGPSKFERDQYQAIKVPGVAIGLAWTPTGGDILFIEAVLSRGKGKLTLTGSLGDVMKESASTALSFIKSHSDDFGLDPEIFHQWDIHLHVPEGAIPKDGPSAGITMMTTLASAFMQRRVKPHLAMTGEITLRGKVLPIGGVKEKLLAAKRAGIKDIILCEANRKDLEEIDKKYLGDLKIHYVEDMMEVINIALTKSQVKNALDITLRKIIKEEPPIGDRPS